MTWIGRALIVLTVLLASGCAATAPAAYSGRLQVMAEKDGCKVYRYEGRVIRYFAVCSAGVPALLD